MYLFSNSVKDVDWLLKIIHLEMRITKGKDFDSHVIAGGECFPFEVSKS